MWFSTDAACLDYLEWLRWPDGFVCSQCGEASEAWRQSDGRYKCPACGQRTSVTADTIFELGRLPLAVLFTAIWRFATSKNGICALALQRDLGIKSYQTAWTLLRKVREVLVRPDRELLSGEVEVNEAFFPVRVLNVNNDSHGKKPLVGVAIERSGTNHLGRLRMGPIASRGIDDLRRFIRGNAEEALSVPDNAASTLITVDQ